MITSPQSRKKLPPKPRSWSRVSPRDQSRSRSAFRHPPRHPQLHRDHERRAVGAAAEVVADLERGRQLLRPQPQQSHPRETPPPRNQRVGSCRLKPRQLKLQEGLTVPRALETFVVRIQGRGPGRAPKLSNFGLDGAVFFSQRSSRE